METQTPGAARHAPRKGGGRRRFASAVLAALGVSVLAWLWTGRAVRYGALREATIVPDSAPGDAYAVERVGAVTTTGRRLVCAVRTPRPPVTRPVTALLVAGGQAAGRGAVHAVGRAFGGVVMACDYPWAPLLEGALPRLIWRLPRLRAEVLATPSLLGVAASYLAARPEVDTTRLVAVGASLGVPPIAAWAARDPRPRAVALLYGGGDLLRPLELLLGGEVGLGAARRPAARLLAWLLAPLEPARHVAALAPRPVLIVGGADDERVPAASVALLAEAAREPKQVVWLHGAHLRPGEAALLAQLSDTALAWLARVMPAARGGSSPSRSALGRDAPVSARRAPRPCRRRGPSRS